MIWPIVIASWLAWCGLNAAIASQKGRSVGGVFLLSFALSPLLGFLYILAVPALTPQTKPLDPTLDIPSAAPPPDVLGRGTRLVLLLILVCIGAAVAVATLTGGH